MFEEELTECETILEQHGLPVPDINIETTWQLLSYTYSDGVIYIGVATRALNVINKKAVKHSILHEMLHNLCDDYWPPLSVRDVFGDLREWNEDQDFIKYLSFSNDYVSNYAKTHPEEDLIETAAFVLEGKERDCPKVRAVKEWFKELAE